MPHLRNLHAFFGLDLGQTTDPSALTLVANIEQIHSPQAWIDPSHPRTHHWLLVATKVFPLGTAYTDVARHTHLAIQRYKQQHPTTPLHLVADSTGIGRPTLEILYRELTTKPGQPQARLEGIVFTASGQHSKSSHPTLPVDLFHVPKLDLIEALVHSIESGQLQPSPNLSNQSTLAAQLQSLRYATSRLTGQTTIEVSKSSDPKIGHADLVMALAMCNWRLKTLYPTNLSTQPHRLPGF
jgi:hypothetical protein